jgi:hypothetical protein
MNEILNMRTFIFTSIVSPCAEAQGMLSDRTNRFRRHRKIYDILSTHIMMCEDAKMSRKRIYTAYSDFKGAFGSMDHRILFQTMRDLGFLECYINTCEQLNKVTGTYYITPHGNSHTIPIHP